MNDEPLIEKDRETRTSAEGIRSTHVEYRGGRVDCQIVVPALKVRQRVGNERKESLWPKCGDLYLPLGGEK